MEALMSKLSKMRSSGFGLRFSVNVTRLESSPKTAKINSEVLTSISRRPKRTKFRHHQSLRTAPLRKQKAKRLSTEDFLPRPLLARRREIKYEGKERGKQRNSQQIRNTIPLLQHFYATRLYATLRRVTWFVLSILMLQITKDQMQRSRWVRPSRIRPLPRTILI